MAELEQAGARERERERQTDRMSVFVCVLGRRSACMLVCLCVTEKEGDIQNECACTKKWVCVNLRQREREREWEGSWNDWWGFKKKVFFVFLHSGLIHRSLPQNGKNFWMSSETKFKSGWAERSHLSNLGVDIIKCFVLTKQIIFVVGASRW